MKKLFGVVCATITPMSKEGKIDIESARRLYSYLADEEIHCLYPNGTNGESLSLSAEERMDLAKTAVQAGKGKQSIYIQCGASTVKETYQHVLNAKQIDADGAGVMTPVFFPMDEAAMEQYYVELLEQTGDFPIYVYCIPTRAGNDFSPALLGKLMDAYPALQGVKYSYPDLLRLKAYRNAPSARKADALIGCDLLAHCCMISGGTGWVSGPAAVFPKLHVRLYHQIMENQMTAAQKTQEQISQILGQMSDIPEIPAIKYMLMKAGILATDTVRMPLRMLNQTEKQRLDRLLADTEVWR